MKSNRNCNHMIILNDRFFAGTIIGITYIVIMYVFHACHVKEQRNFRNAFLSFKNIVIYGSVVALILNLLLFLILVFNYGTFYIFSKSYEQISFVTMIAFGCVALYLVFSTYKHNSRSEIPPTESACLDSFNDPANLKQRMTDDLKTTDEISKRD